MGGLGSRGCGFAQEGLAEEAHPGVHEQGHFESPTGARWTAGELYQDNVGGYPIAYAYGNKYDPLIMYNSKRDVAELLNEHEKKKSGREFLRQQQMVPQQRRKEKQQER